MTDITNAPNDFAPAVLSLASITPTTISTNNSITAQHNTTQVGKESIFDFEDTARITYTITDDSGNTRIKISADLAQNGAATGSIYRWSGTAWTPTTNVIWDDSLSKLTLAGDTNLYRSAAGQLKTDGIFISSSQVYSQPGTNGAGFLYNPAAGGTAGIAFQSVIQGEANQRFKVLADGTLSWGAGGASAVDTNLFRRGAGILAIQSAGITSLNIESTQADAPGDTVSINLLPSTLFVGSTPAVQIQGVQPNLNDGHAQLRFQINTGAGIAEKFRFDGNGRLYFDPGVALDTYLYRYAAGTLVTGSGTTAVYLGTPNGTNAGIQFSNDTNLYRSAAGALKTDGALDVAGRVDGTVDGQVSATGTIVLGTGYSVSHGSTGNYTVTFTNAFAAAPIVVVSIADATNQNGQISVNGVTTTGFNVSAFDATGTLANRVFNFIAIRTK